MKHVLVVGGSLLGALVAGSASAMPHCGERADLVTALADRYSENHVASGLQSATGLMEIWVSEQEGTWTILMTRPDGQTCVLVTGTHWLETVDAEMPSGDPA
jgi:hypothetical protein